MDLSAEEVVQGILNDEAYETPSDTVKIKEVDMKLPDWYDEDKFNQGCRFFWNFCFGLVFSMVIGFLGILSVPSILKVLVGSQRSNTPYTAYKRYLSTLFHMSSWYSNDLKPGSLSWRSFHTVRHRHLQAGKVARLKNQGRISQRDLSLTMLSLISFTVLKPNKFNITQLNKRDMEAYIHTWAVIGFMVGCEDRYNICRKTFDETYEVCQMLVDRVYTPCLDNVPEYFEHSARAMVRGMSAVFFNIDGDFLIYWTKYLADIPGYIYTEEDRVALQRRLRKFQNGQDDDTGVDSKRLIQQCQLAAPAAAPTASRLLYVRDYETVAGSPAYTNLPTRSKFNMALFNILMSIYSTFVGRLVLNFYYRALMFLVKYFPFTAIMRYGFSNAFIDMFKEDPKDETPPKLNSEYYNKNEKTWYQALNSFIW